MPAAARIPIRFDAWYRVLSTALVILPTDSYVEVTGETVTVRMGWALRASFPRATVARTSRLNAAPISRGVHGFAGRWLVNGAGDRILVIHLDPVQRARVLGVPVRLRQLMVSVDDPEVVAEKLRADGPL